MLQEAKPIEKTVVEPEIKKLIRSKNYFEAATLLYRTMHRSIRRDERTGLLDSEARRNFPTIGSIFLRHTASFAVFAAAVGDIALAEELFRLIKINFGRDKFRLFKQKIRNPDNRNSFGDALSNSTMMRLSIRLHKGIEEELARNILFFMGFDPFTNLLNDQSVASSSHHTSSTANFAIAMRQLGSIKISELLLNNILAAHNITEAQIITSSPEFRDIATITNALFAQLLIEHGMKEGAEKILNEMNERIGYGMHGLLQLCDNTPEMANKYRVEDTASNAETGILLLELAKLQRMQRK
jgi:hypothetical protein